jgi:quercetin dioxygenase-like cupin family protein
MNSADTHGEEHADLVSLYALQALPASEAAVVEARLAECVGCRQELEALRPIVDAFVSWPTNVLRPSTSLWEQLTRRIAAETGTEPLVPAPPRETGPEWKDVAPGISVKLLATDSERKSVTMLVRLEPNTDYPGHRHAGVEELHLLEGVLRVDEKTYYPGDYLRSEPGTVDHRVWSETGCTCVLMTSYDDVLF